MPRIGRISAMRIVLNTMCNGGFMRGWFGDVSPEFREDKISEFLSMTPTECRTWMESNRSNLLRYCRVPWWVLMIAQG